jgi:predicted nucleotidyltransferase
VAFLAHERVKRILSYTLKDTDAGSEEMPAVSATEDRQDVYIRWLRRRAFSPAVKNKKLYARAWEVARATAKLLKERYGVDRVRVFGSLVHAGRFHSGSDIDLAVEGLKSVDYWEAMTSVLFFDNQIPVELVEKTECRPEIWEVVEREGVDL